jgi:Tol biopolymer transport system component
VRNGGNVRTLPSKAGSSVLDQINAGETVVLRMRAPNGQWYSIVDPRSVTGWVWVELLTIDPTVAATVPVGSVDPGVTAATAPTPPPAADVDGPQIIEWEGLRIVPPMGYHYQSRPPDGVRLYGFPVRATLALLSSVPPLDGTEQLNGMIFTLVQFKGTPQEWLDLLRQANDMEFGLDESTVQATQVAGHPAISYQAGPFQQYIVTGQPGMLLLIDNGARTLEHQQVIDSLTFTAHQVRQGRDMGQIAYIQDGDQSLWLLDLATSHARQVAVGPSHDPAWSPDGQWLAFTGGLENTDISMVHPDGSDETPVTYSPDQEQLPAFSPSGTLFFVRHRMEGARSAYEIVKHESVGQDKVVYTLPAGSCGPAGLRFASDTRFALSLTCGPDKSQNVLVGDLKTGQTQDVEHNYPLNGGCVYNGVWAHQSEQRLAVLISNVCTPQRHSAIYVVDISSPDPPREQDFAGKGIGTLDWSPDDRAVVFDTTKADGQLGGMWLLTIGDQSQPRQISQGGTQPAWRPT